MIELPPTDELELPTLLEEPETSLEEEDDDGLLEEELLCSTPPEGQLLLGNPPNELQSFKVKGPSRHVSLLRQ
jgi:hypothetical protein